MNTQVKLCGMTLSNPIIPASGTFGYGLEFSELYDINILGSFSIKGTTLLERYGNPLPRIAETPSGMLNAVGLQNPGLFNVVADIFPKLKKVYHKQVIANIGGSTFDDYVKAVEVISKEDIVGAIELNISCPNVACGGMAFGTSPTTAKELTSEVKKVSHKPVIVKLSPNVTDIKQMAKAVCDGGADGVSLINTLLGMAVDYKTGKPIIANTYAGFSGSAVKPVALRMVHQVYSAIGKNIPIIGMGGIENEKDVIEFMSVGATAVMVGSANLVNPFVCRDIIQNLPSVMKEIGVDNLSDIIGRSHN